MQQNSIWMHFFIIGILFGNALFNTGCIPVDVDYGMRFGLTYTNQTDSVIAFVIRPYIYSNKVEEITLNPKSTIEIYNSQSIEGPKDIIVPDSYRNALGSAYLARTENGYSKTLLLNDSLCVTHLNERSVLIENYAQEKIANRNYKYTYTFTDDDFKVERIEPCEGFDGPPNPTN